MRPLNIICDYLVVGAGLFGATFAHMMHNAGKKVIVIEKESKVGGMCSTEYKNGIHIHEYGPHIFHTNNKKVWDFITTFDTFLPFTNQPLANYKGKLYNLPFNMNTFRQLFGVRTPAEAREAINSTKISKNGDSIESYALNTVGSTIYNYFIKEYTEKQWGRKCNELPAEIIKRIPLKFTYNNNYFNDLYQGIPQHGYTELIKNMLDGIEIYYNISYKEFCFKCSNIKCQKIIYTGPIDEYFDYKLGELEYRSLDFKHYWVDDKYSQGNAVINYTSNDVSYTRSIEHKYFYNEESVDGTTLITYEYPLMYEGKNKPFYPINNQKNNDLYKKYIAMGSAENIYFCGRLGSYRYINMDRTVEDAIKLSDRLLSSL